MTAAERFVQGRFEKSTECLAGWDIELRKAIGDSCRIGAQFERAEKPIPPGKERGIVRVSLRLKTGVMHFVNARRHNEPPEKTVQISGQGNIGVMQLDHGKHERFIEDQFPQTQPEQENDRNSKDRREKDFPEVKTVGRSDIHFRIGMMGAMEPPEKTEPVVCAMPPIHPEIEKDDGEQHACPGRERQQVEDTEAM